jgi:hypothetical protein
LASRLAVPVLLTLPGLVPSGEGKNANGQVTIKERATLLGHKSLVASVAFSPDGKTAGLRQL